MKVGVFQKSNDWVFLLKLYYARNQSLPLECLGLVDNFLFAPVLLPSEKLIPS